MLRPLYNKIRGKSSTDGYEQYDKAESGATPAQGISLDNMGNNSNKRRKGSTKMGLNETTLGGTIMDTWIDHTKRQGSDEDILISQRSGGITVITEIDSQSRRTTSVAESATEHARR